jgi:hypothetical protein
MFITLFFLPNLQIDPKSWSVKNRLTGWEINKCSNVLVLFISYDENEVLLVSCPQNLFFWFPGSVSDKCEGQDENGNQKHFFLIFMKINYVSVWRTTYNRDLRSLLRLAFARIVFLALATDIGIIN